MSEVVLQPQLSVPKSGSRWMVVIFNNETNTVHEVIDVLILATGCTIEEAAIETWEAHTYGQAAVHFDTEPTCHEVARLIGSIGVRTEVQPEWAE